MFYASKQDESIEAKDARKEDGPFFCLGCAARVILKKGTIKAPHFAHLVDRGCRYGQRERLTIEQRVLRVCWLCERDMRNLLVKDLIWKEGWLYAVMRWGDFEPYLETKPPDDANAYKKYIRLVGEHWVPVIVGQEHVLLQLTEGRAPEEHVFPEIHMPSRRALRRLKRQYVSRLYTMFSGLTPPVDTRRSSSVHNGTDVNYRYDPFAVYDIMQVLEEPLYLADEVAFSSIGRRSHGKRTPAVKKRFGAND